MTIEEKKAALYETLSKKITDDYSTDFNEACETSARENNIDDRELLAILMMMQEGNFPIPNIPALIVETKKRILANAPTFNSIICDHGTGSLPKITNVDQYVAVKDLKFFGENVQITGNLAANTNGVRWELDSKRKNPQFTIVYKVNDAARPYRTLFISDADARQIGDAMLGLDVKDCWMFDANGVPSTANPLVDIDREILEEGEKAAVDLAIFYGNLNYLKSLQSANAEAKVAYLKSRLRSENGARVFEGQVKAVNSQGSAAAVEFCSSVAASE
jgi:hypothetical protein